MRFLVRVRVFMIDISLYKFGRHGKLAGWKLNPNANQSQSPVSQKSHSSQHR